MTRYQVDSDEVAAATTNVRAVSARIQGDVSAMHSRLLELQGTWTGGASAGFQALLSEWRTTQQRVEECLAGITGALESAGRGYAETEAANTRLFAG